jgi:hypothetical protein
MRGDSDFSRGEESQQDLNIFSLPKAEVGCPEVRWKKGKGFPQGLGARFAEGNMMQIIMLR